MLSRVANSLYWMSRYLERTEHTARLLDVNMVLMLDQDPAQADQRWQRLLNSLYVRLPEQTGSDPQQLVQTLTFDRSIANTISTTLEAARDNARQVRAQLSSEMWEQLNRLYLQISATAADDGWHAQPHTLFRTIIEGTQLFHGLTEATMPHTEGWHFMQAGRFIERASATAALLDAHFHTDQPSLDLLDIDYSYLDYVGLLKSCTSFEAYCQVYTADLQPDRIIAFLLFDRHFPHSIHYAARHVHTALGTIARLNGARTSDQIERCAGKLHALLEYGQIDDVLAGGLPDHLKTIQSQCQELHNLLQRTYFQPPLEAVLPS